MMGCAGEVTEPPAGTTPLNDTPKNTVRRFESFFERKDSGELHSLLTSDYTFEFSPTVDGSLCIKYSDGWSKEDESLCMRHMFYGGSTNHGWQLRHAERILLELSNYSTAPEPGKDGNKFQTVVVTASLRIELSRCSQTGERIVMELEGPPYVHRHRFYLVRGDAAVLAEGQPADANHWYIWKWCDETTREQAAVSGTSAAAAGDVMITGSWGSLKDFCR
jgi:hypothetical protein